MNITLEPAAKGLFLPNLRDAVASGSPDLLLAAMKGKASRDVAVDSVFELLAEHREGRLAPHVATLVSTAIGFGCGPEGLSKLHTSAYFKVLVAHRPDLFTRFVQPGGHLTHNWMDWHRILLYALSLPDPAAAQALGNVLIFLCHYAGLHSPADVVRDVEKKSKWCKEPIDLARLETLSRAYFQRLETDEDLKAQVRSISSYNAKFVEEKDE